jgi:hypothetical protein
MYLRALRGYENAWGAEHTSTLDTVNNVMPMMALNFKSSLPLDRSLIFVVSSDFSAARRAVSVCVPNGSW